MNKEIQEAVKQAALWHIDHSEGMHTGELSENRKSALDYYYGRPNAAPSMPGRSKQQSTDVADMTEAVLAQIMPAFEIDSVCEFEPFGEDDEQQAAAESDAVNYVIMESNNGFYELQTAIKDALLLRNGFTKVWLEETSDTVTETYTDLTDMEYTSLFEDAAQNAADVVILEQDIQDGLHTVKARITTFDRQLKSAAVDVCRMRWFKNHTSIYLQDIPFIAEQSYPTRSDLIEQGYSKSLVDGLNSTSMEAGSDASARSADFSDDDYLSVDRATERVEHYECYLRYDADGDGIAELLKVCIADRTLLGAEPIAYIPYASGTPFIRAHRFNGISLFDKVAPVQDSKTHTLRQWLDNLNHNNNSRTVVYGQGVVMDSVTNSRPGGVIDARRGMQGDVQPLAVNDIGPSCETALNYLDKMRSERGGASLDLQSAQMQVIGETAHGIERQMSSKEQLAAMITRTLAETLVRSMFVLVHTALRLHYPESLTIRQRGQYNEVTPSNWRARDRVNVRAGLSNAERGRKKSTLEQILMQQQTDAQMGVYVDPSSVYQAKLDWGRSAGLDNPERYFSDPASEQAQMAAQQQQKMQQQQQMQQEQILQMQMQIENQKHEIEQQKVQLDAAQGDQELQFKYWAEQLKAEIEEAKLMGNAALEIGVKEIDNERASSAIGDGSGGTDQGGRDRAVA